MLLPRAPHSLSTELFFIVACVNQSSAEVLVEQLRGRLARVQSLRDSMLRAEISFVLLGTRSKNEGVRSEGTVNEGVVNHIEDLMKTALRNRGGGLYEWTQSSHSR